MMRELHRYRRHHAVLMVAAIVTSPKTGLRCLSPELLVLPFCAAAGAEHDGGCLLYTSDAADDMQCRS
eukprot:11619124-Alexandrium_andersonii.AAC.1